MSLRDSRIRSSPVYVTPGVVREGPDPASGKRFIMETDGIGKSPFLTTKEAARFLRVSERTLQNWRYASLGPVYRKHVGVVVYHFDDLLRFSASSHRSGDATNDQ